MTPSKLRIAGSYARLNNDILRGFKFPTRSAEDSLARFVGSRLMRNLSAHAARLQKSLLPQLMTIPSLLGVITPMSAGAAGWGRQRPS